MQAQTKMTSTKQQQRLQQRVLLCSYEIGGLGRLKKGQKRVRVTCNMGFGSSDITGREHLGQIYLLAFVLSQDRQASRPSCPTKTCQQIANQQRSEIG